MQAVLGRLFLAVLCIVNAKNSDKVRLKKYSAKSYQK
jgi:hypothetical protein